MKKETKLNYDYIKQVTEIPRLFILSLSKKEYSSRPKNILIINTCLIGDIAASLSALRQFIIKKPHSTIDVIVPPPMKSVIEKVKGVNKVYTAKSVTNRSIENINIPQNELEELLKKKYDLILVIRLSKDAYTLVKKLKYNEIEVSPFSYLRYLLHLLRRIIKKGEVKQYSQVNFEWFGEKQKHFSFNEIFSFTKDDYKRVENLPVMSGKEKKILIHAGFGWRKDWENKKWIELIKKINKLGKFKFIFIGGEKKEEDNFEIIQKKINFKIYSIIKRVNLGELFLIMKLSDYFIGIDSGPRNMAHLSNLRSVSLLGPGPKHFMPNNKKDVIIDKSNCKCTHLFCFKKKTCIQKINVDEVYAGFKKLLEYK